MSPHACGNSGRIQGAAVLRQRLNALAEAEGEGEGEEEWATSKPHECIESQNSDLRVERTSLRPPILSSARARSGARFSADLRL